MKSFTKTILSLFFLVAVATSCKKPVPLQVKHIPKNATFVAVINTKALAVKMLANQATLENIMKSAVGDDTSAAKGKQEWEDLQQSGLDLSSNFYLSFAQKDGGATMGKGSMIFAAIGTLNSEDKLEKYLKKKKPQAEIKKEKNYTYTTLDGGSMVAWSKDLVVAMNYQNAAGSQMEYDSATGEFNIKPQANSDASLKTEMDNYFTLKEDQSVAAIPEFRDMMQNSSDASMWVNTASSMQSIPLPRVKELFGNSYMAATLNFEDGKVVVESKSYYSKEMKDLLKKYMTGEANLGLVEKYPSANINGFMVMAMNPEFVNDMVKQLELGGMADAQLTKMMGSNYTLSDMLKALKGDMAFIVSDFAGSSFKMIGDIAIGDKTQMNKLMDKLVELKMMVKSPTGYFLNPEMSKGGFGVTVDDKNILISNNDTVLNSFKSSTATATIDKDVMSELKGKQVAAYVNLQSIINGLSKIPTTDTSMTANIAKAKETFKDMRMYANKYDGKELTGHYELRLVNEKENSLASLLKFAEAMSKTMNYKKEMKMEMPAGADSIPVSMR